MLTLYLLIYYFHLAFSQDVALLEDSRDVTTGAAARIKALDDLTVEAEKKAQQLEIFTDVLGHMLNTVQKSCVQFTCQIGGIRKALQACDHEFDQVKEMTKTLKRTETAAKEQIFKCRRLVEKNYAHFETTLRGRQKQARNTHRNILKHNIKPRSRWLRA